MNDVFSYANNGFLFIIWRDIHYSRTIGRGVVYYSFISDAKFGLI
jgi:hypothetical protein